MYEKDYFCMRKNLLVSMSDLALISCAKKLPINTAPSKLQIDVVRRGGLASRATGLGPEGPPQQGSPWAPSMLEEKYFKWLIFDELYDDDKTTSFNQRKIG